MTSGTGSTSEREVGRLLQGSALNLVGGVVALIASLVIVALLSRSLGAGGVGAFLTAIALLNLVGRIGLLGAGTGLVRFVSRSVAVHRSSEVRSYLLAGALPALCVTIVIAVLVWVGADTVARVIADDLWHAQVATYVRAGAPFLLALALLSLASAVTRGLGTMVPSNLTENLLRPTLQVLFVWIAIRTGQAATQVAVAYWLPVLVAAVVALLVTKRWLDRMPAALHAGRPATDLGSEYWRFTGFRALATAFAASIEWLDVLLLGALATTATAGVYAAASRYLGVGRAVQYATTQALNPQISRLLTVGDREGAAATFQTATSWSVLLTWPIYVVVLVFAPGLLGLLGPGFAEGATAVRILALAWMFGIAFGPVDAVLLMAGRSWWSMANLGLALTVNIGLNLFLIPRYGATGAAISWFMSVAVHNLLPLLQVRRSLGLVPFGPRANAAMSYTTLAVGLPCVVARALLGPGLGAASTGCLVGGGLLALVLARSTKLDARGLLRAATRRQGGSGATVPVVPTPTRGNLGPGHHGPVRADRAGGEP
jgi:O-antigen/teichoic acid export membrane protein